MPQSALTPAEICSSFCLSRSIGLGAGAVCANVGRANRRNTALTGFNFIISPPRTRGFTKVENSPPSFVFLRGPLWLKLEALSPDQAHGIRYSAAASAWPAI